MEDQKQVIDPANFNAWRKTVNPTAVDYISQGNEKDKSAIDWANKNGYDNSKNYITTETKPNESVPVPVPAVNYGLATQSENEYMQRYAPKANDTYVSRFSSIYPAPKEVTPQQEETQRNAASVAESLKSLAEIYGQSKGAHLQQRTPVENDKAEQQILYNRNKHDEDLRAYQRAYIAASGQDSEELRRLRANAQEYGNRISQNDYLSRKVVYDSAMKEKSTADANAHAELMQKNTQTFQANQADKTHNFTAGQNSLNRQAQADNRPDKFSGIVINAHPNDPHGVNDSSGNRVIKYDMSKAEVQNVANQAKADKKFMAEYGTKDANGNSLITVQKKGIYGNAYDSPIDDVPLANYYQQYKYDKQYTPQKTKEQSFENSNFNFMNENKSVPTNSNSSTPSMFR